MSKKAPSGRIIVWLFDDSGTNVYFYAKQNGLYEIAQLIQKNVVSIFYEASVNK